jgi:hypothetical protein
MHDLILALFFVSLIITPAMIAANTGKESSEPRLVPVKQSRPQATAARREPSKNIHLTYASTLPLHGTRALAGR